MIFLSSLGGTYIENILINSLKLNFSIINQTGLSEWFLLYFSSGISKILGFDIIKSELILGASSFIISIILFIWILSLDNAEINFMKIITRPVVMPFIWVLSMFYSLFFVIQKNNENVDIKAEIEPNLLHYLKNKLTNLNRNFIPRKKPKTRKKTIHYQEVFYSFFSNFASKLIIISMI